MAVGGDMMAFSWVYFNIPAWSVDVNTPHLLWLNAFVSSHVTWGFIIGVLLIYRVRPGVTLENAFLCRAVSFCLVLGPKILGFTTIMRDLFWGPLCVCCTDAILFYCCTLLWCGEGDFILRARFSWRSFKFCKRDSCDSRSLLIPRSPQFLSRIVLRQVSQLANEVNDFNYPSSACRLPSLEMQRRKLNMVCLSGPGPASLPELAWAGLMFMISWIILFIVCSDWLHLLALQETMWGHLVLCFPSAEFNLCYDASKWWI